MVLHHTPLPIRAAVITGLFRGLPLKAWSDTASPLGDLFGPARTPAPIGTKITG
jgi:hypothetical protein